MAVEDEIAYQSVLQLAHRAISHEIDVFISDATPFAFADSVAQGATATVHVDLLDFKQATVCHRRSLTLEFPLRSLGELLHYSPWLVVQFLGQVQ